VQEPRLEEKGLPQVYFVDFDQAVLPIKPMEYECFSTIPESQHNRRTKAGWWGHTSGGNSNNGSRCGAVNSDLSDVVHPDEHSAAWRRQENEKAVSRRDRVERTCSHPLFHPISNLGGDQVIESAAGVQFNLDPVEGDSTADLCFLYVHESVFFGLVDRKRHAGSPVSARLKFRVASAITWPVVTRLPISTFIQFS